MTFVLTMTENLLIIFHSPSVVILPSDSESITKVARELLITSNSLGWLFRLTALSLGNQFNPTLNMRLQLINNESCFRCVYGGDSERERVRLSKVKSRNE